MFCGATFTWWSESKQPCRVRRRGLFGYIMCIRIFVSERATNVDGGQRIDFVALPPPPLGGSFCGFDALPLDKRIFGRYFIMSHINASWRVDSGRPMEHDGYMLQLRHALVTVGVPGDEHCLRYVDGMARVCMLTGLMDRLRVSWSLGL